MKRSAHQGGRVSTNLSCKVGGINNSEIWIRWFTDSIESDPNTLTGNIQTLRKKLSVYPRRATDRARNRILYTQPHRPETASHDCHRKARTDPAIADGTIVNWQSVSPLQPPQIVDLEACKLREKTIEKEFLKLRTGKKLEIDKEEEKKMTRGILIDLLGTAGNRLMLFAVGVSLNPSSAREACRAISAWSWRHAMASYIIKRKTP
ncbi:his/Glu/Gln/Arg/opine family ABC transporter [Striga asiatica]|uniref:His/Glu/Gln/Arg/opine family ABC transporter n=1 Tax=Striga asiatica TaxID=4170 RepID=A0A5A7QPD7_STRAF|nr:his/Glu/Gln/Arg/opine family ABC transporter [Striga asiatica]